MEQYEVTVLAGGNPFWCVDEESRLLEWIENNQSARFAMNTTTLSTVRTVSLDPSAAALELKWTTVEAPSPWRAAEKAIASIEGVFPDLVGAPFLRVQATLQSESEDVEGRWSKLTRARR
jgi:hypothetical protein